MEEETPVHPAAPDAPSPDASPAAAAPLPLPDENLALAAYDHWAPIVRADPTLVPQPPRTDANRAWRNATRGTKAALAHKAELSEKLPTTNWQLLESAPSLALAMVAASALAQRGSAGSSDVGRLYREVTTLRRLLLDSLKGPVDKGLVPAADVGKIRQGSGTVDAAQDCLALVALFRKYDGALAGKTAVEPADLEAAQVRSTALIAAIHNPQAGDAATYGKDRDLLWAALNRVYDEVRRAGGYKWLDDLRAHVPTLGQAE